MEIIIQTLTIQVKDDFMTEFMKMIDTVKENVVVQKDKSLEVVSMLLDNLNFKEYVYENYIR